MKCIKDLTPDGRRGHVAQLSLVPNDDQVICRSVFNLNYLEKVVKALKKDIGKTKNQPIVEIQFVRPRYAKKNGMADDDAALIMRASSCTPQFISQVQRQNEPGPVYPSQGYYGIGPLHDIWLPSSDLEMLPGIYPPVNITDPCGGRDCDQCEIGGCDHGIEVS